jgi:hypothetical protein
MKVLLENQRLICGTRVKGGENVMSKSKRIGVAIVSIIFLVALVSAVPVDAKKGFSTHRWWSEVSLMDMNGDIWTGGPEGKYDGLHGTIHWDNQGAIYLGPEGRLPYLYPDAKVQKFWGEWWIDWDGGDHIEGTHDGSFTYAISQSTVNGRVTETTGDWSYLEGRSMHSLGYIDWNKFTLEYYIQIN